MYPFLCKRFSNGSWEVLGTIHAKDNAEAWEKAIAKWGKVDSVYDLYSCD